MDSGSPACHTIILRCEAGKPDKPSQHLASRIQFLIGAPGAFLPFLCVSRRSLRESSPHSIIPLLHYSFTPSLHHSITPLSPCKALTGQMPAENMAACRHSSDGGLRTWWRSLSPHWFRSFSPGGATGKRPLTAPTWWESGSPSCFWERLSRNFFGWIAGRRPGGRT